MHAYEISARLSSMVPTPRMSFLERLWKAMAGLMVLALVSCATTSTKDRELAKYRLRIGTAYLETGDYPAALRELLLAEKLDPKNEMIQNNLGLTYFFRERYDLAAEHLKRAVELKPTFTEARNNYARVLIEQAKYEEALKELKTVLDDLTYSDPAKAWVNVGLAYFNKGDFAQAKNALATAIQIDRNHCLGQTLYGRSLLELGELTAAARALDNAVVVCRPSKFDEPHYYSGLTYYKLGKTSAAIARLEEVIKLYPQGQYAKKAESMLKLMK